MATTVTKNPITWIGTILAAVVMTAGSILGIKKAKERADAKKKEQAERDAEQGRR